MDEIDKKILNLLQTEFPIEAEPFRIIAEKIGVGEDEVLERIGTLKKKRVIRRIGAGFDVRNLGHVSVLCAARVHESDIANFVKTVNAYTGVTHNYRRDHDYNIWFTFISPSEEDLLASIEEIKRKTGVKDILSMKAVRKFKIDATFEV